MNFRRPQPLEKNVWKSTYTIIAYCISSCPHTIHLIGLLRLSDFQQSWFRLARSMLKLKWFVCSLSGLFLFRSLWREFTSFSLPLTSSQIQIRKLISHHFIFPPIFFVFLFFLRSRISGDASNSNQHYVCPESRIVRLRNSMRQFHTAQMLH